MGSGAISWASKKEPIVALFIAEVEYVAATAVACQAVWMRRMLRSLYQEKIAQLLHYPRILCFIRERNTLTQSFITSENWEVMEKMF